MLAYERLLDEPLSLGVNRGGGLVQNQDRRVFHPFDMWVALMKRLTPQSDMGRTRPSLDV